MIRPARQDDLPQLLELGRRMHQESVYRDFEFCERKLTSYLSMVLDTPGRYCLHVAEREGRIVGFLAGYLEEFLFGRQTVAHDTAFFVDRSQRGTTTAKRLIDAFRGWARERGARELCLGVSSGIEPERVGAFYERLGLSRVGAIYKERLSPRSDDG